MLTPCGLEKGWDKLGIIFNEGQNKFKTSWLGSGFSRCQCGTDFELDLMSLCIKFYSSMTGVTFYGHTSNPCGVSTT